MAHVTINRTRLFALFTFLLAISPLMAIEASAAVIDINFGDYPPGTTITDQYPGVIFSGAPAPPVINPLGFDSCFSPALSGYPLGPEPRYGSGSISVSFFDPTNGTPAEPFWIPTFYFCFLYNDESIPATIIYYDMNGGIIGQVENYWPDQSYILIPDGTHKIVVDPGATNYVWISNLDIIILPTPCDIDPVCCNSKDPCCGTPDDPCCKDQPVNGGT